MTLHDFNSLTTEQQQTILDRYKLRDGKVSWFETWTASPKIGFPPHDGMDESTSVFQEEQAEEAMKHIKSLMNIEEQI